MIHYKEITETVTREVPVKKTCDMCGREARVCSRGDWSKDSFDVNETEIRHRTGTQYPEGGSGEEIKIDICSDCFTQKLIPWLESEGVQAQKTEWDW